MQNLHRLLLSSRLSTSSLINKTLTLQNQPSSFLGVLSPRTFSDRSNRNNPNDRWEQGWDNLPKQDPSSSDSSFSGWDSVSSWSTGLADQHFDGQAVGRQVISGAEDLKSGNDGDGENDTDYRRSKAYVDSWDDRMQDMSVLMKQVREPGARGSYLKDSEKAEMYRLHKENPELYTVEKLAKDYRIMRQRVHAILWLKEIEEEEEKKLGHPLDDSIEVLIDTCPEFFESHCKEFHVASLPYKPDFKVMPEGWDGTTRDPDEVLYEISKKEDEMLYQEFVQRMNFNKKKIAGEIKSHKYSRRRSSEGWKITVEKLGPRGKRGGGGGWKFVSLPDGSSRALNEIEKMFVRRETPKRRRKIFP